VYRALSLEAAAGEGDVKPPVLHLDRLHDLAGLSVADLPLVRNLINAVVISDVAPCGHTLLLGGAT
jgi:hypothetical protein